MVEFLPPLLYSASTCLFLSFCVSPSVCPSVCLSLLFPLSSFFFSASPPSIFLSWFLFYFFNQVSFIRVVCRSKCFISVATPQKEMSEGLGALWSLPSMTVCVVSPSLEILSWKCCSSIMSTRSAFHAYFCGYYIFQPLLPWFFSEIWRRWGRCSQFSTSCKLVILSTTIRI